jgi:thioredoxin reductase
MAYDGRGPAEWRADARRDLAAYSRRDGEERGGEVRDARVVSLRRVQGGGLGDPRPTIFEATDDAGRVTRARKVVLATGVRDVLLDIPGTLAPYSVKLTRRPGPVLGHARDPLPVLPWG